MSRCQDFTAVTPTFGRLVAIEARLEGEYRAGVGRVARESKEFASVPISDLYVHLGRSIKASTTAVSLAFTYAS